MKRTHDVKPKEGAVARALEDALAPKQNDGASPTEGTEASHSEQN
jgi:hypothetical protein